MIVYCVVCVFAVAEVGSGSLGFYPLLLCLIFIEELGFLLRVEDGSRIKTGIATFIYT